jgi:hypothetical protein
MVQHTPDERPAFLHRTGERAAAVLAYVQVAGTNQYIKAPPYRALEARGARQRCRPVLHDFTMLCTSLEVHPCTCMRIFTPLFKHARCAASNTAHRIMQPCSYQHSRKFSLLFALVLLQTKASCSRTAAPRTQPRTAKCRTSPSRSQRAKLCLP